VGGLKEMIQKTTLAFLDIVTQYDLIRAEIELIQEKDRRRSWIT
jgi:hypothetical protein